jgi:hypothetical protein
VIVLKYVETLSHCSLTTATMFNSEWLQWPVQHHYITYSSACHIFYIGQKYFLL